MTPDQRSLAFPAVAVAGIPSKAVEGPVDLCSRNRSRSLRSHHRIDHLFDDAIWMIDSDFRGPEQKARFPVDPAEVCQKCLADLSFGAHPDSVNHLNEQVDQAVGDFLASLVTERRHQRETDWLRMPSEFTRFLCGRSDAILLEDLACHASEHFIRQPDCDNAPQFAISFSTLSRLGRPGSALNSESRKNRGLEPNHQPSDEPVSRPNSAE